MHTVSSRADWLYRYYCLTDKSIAAAATICKFWQGVYFPKR